TRLWRSRCSCFVRTCLTSLFSVPGRVTTVSWPLSLHDALPIYTLGNIGTNAWSFTLEVQAQVVSNLFVFGSPQAQRTTCAWTSRDRKSTRLNSSHDQTSYAVARLKKKTVATPLLAAPAKAFRTW